MISTLGKYFAASSAKRIIKIAPIEKFGTSIAPSPRSRATASSVSHSSIVHPLTPMTGRTSCASAFIEICTLFG